MNKKILSFILIFGLCIPLLLNAQSLEETLSKLSMTAAKSYVSPVISAFGSNLNSGWVSRAPSATKLGLYLDIKLVGTGSFFPNDVKNFNTGGEFKFTSAQADQILQGQGKTPTSMGQANYDNLKQQIIAQQFQVNFSGPTINGSKNDYLKIRFPGAAQLGVQPYDLDVKEAKGFLDEMPLFPTAVAQLTVGTIMGTHFAVRYFPDYDIKDMGKFSYLGFGAIHNPGVWFENPLPVDLGIAYFTQTLKVGNVFESTASQYGLYVSKSIGFIISVTPYAGITMETSKTTVHYKADLNVQGVIGSPDINFDLEGENAFAAVAGCTLHIAAINISADFKFAKTKTASLGIAFGL